MKKTLISSVALLFLVGLCGQNAYAIAIADSVASFNWSSLQVSGPGALTSGVVTYDDLSKLSLFSAGYSTPNNASDESPIYRDPHDWGDASRTRSNPAGTAYGISKAETVAGQQGLYGNVFARADGTHYGDIDVNQYSGTTETLRYGVFQVDQSGAYTFTIGYSLAQHILVQDYVHDLAITTANFQFFGGSGSSIYDGTWTNNPQDISYTLRYDTPYEPYEQWFNYSDTLSFTMDLIANTDYWLSGEIYNLARTGSYGLTSDPPQPTPEPATIVLLSSGFLGAVFARRKAAKSI